MSEEDKEEQAKQKLMGMIYSSIDDGVWLTMQREGLFVVVDGVCLQVELHVVPEWKAKG